MRTDRTLMSLKNQPLPFKSSGSTQSAFFPHRAAAAFFAISLRFPLGMCLRASTAAALAIVAISRRRSGVSDAALIRARAAAGFSDFLDIN